MRTELKRRIATLEQTHRARISAPKLLINFVEATNPELPMHEQRMMNFKTYQFGSDGQLKFVKKGRTKWPQKTS